jgi:hypothetical protein
MISFCSLFAQKDSLVDLSFNKLIGAFDFNQTFFSRIKYFDISNNLIDSITAPSSVQPCRYIDISNNPMNQHLDSEWFVGFPNAEVLKMHNNGFSLIINLFTNTDRSVDYGLSDRKIR